MEQQTVSARKRPSIIIIAVAVLAVVVFGILAVAFGKAAPTSTVKTKGPAFGIYINPLTTNTTAGRQVTAAVYANPSTHSVQTISAYIHYNPSLLRLDSVDQVGVDPNLTVTSRCSSTDGCKQPGDIVLVAGYSGTGAIEPKNGLLVGNLKFTALKSGTAPITIDTDPKLSGFISGSTSQSVLDTRSVSNGTINITKKKGRR